MNRCEDFPCCGHGPPPMGDGGGCPDEDGRFQCVECGDVMPRGSSSICKPCRKTLTARIGREDEYYDDYSYGR